MKVTLDLLISDARSTSFNSNEDCTAARALNRVLKSEFKASCGTATFSIWKGVAAYKGRHVYQGRLEYTDAMNTDLLNSGKDGKHVVEIPKEFLKPKGDKYEQAISYLCGIRNAKKRSGQVFSAWFRTSENQDKGGVLFSFLTEKPAATVHEGCYTDENGLSKYVGCVSQIAAGGWNAPTESLRQYIKAQNIVQPNDLRELPVKQLRIELEKYATIQRAVDICFRYKPEDVVKL